MLNMTRAELVAIFDEITTILENEGSAVEKLSRIEAVMFEPASLGQDADEVSDSDED